MCIPLCVVRDGVRPRMFPESPLVRVLHAGASPDTDLDRQPATALQAPLSPRCQKFKPTPSGPTPSLLLLLMLLLLPSCVLITIHGYPMLCCRSSRPRFSLALPRHSGASRDRQDKTILSIQSPSRDGTRRGGLFIIRSSPCMPLCPFFTGPLHTDLLSR